MTIAGACLFRVAASHKGSCAMHLVRLLFLFLSEERVQDVVKRQKGV